MILERLQSLVEELNRTNSSTDKVNTLKKYKDDVDIRKILMYIYTPFKQYHLTSSNLKKNKDLWSDEVPWKNIFDMLDDLCARKYTGHEAIGMVNTFIGCNLQYAQLIYNIIDRDLKTRATGKIINKAIPKCIPTFDVALAKSSDDESYDFSKEEWFISRKLDGIRCICIIDEHGNVSTHSRAGNRFETLSLIEDEIRSLNLSSVVLDGEICVMSGASEDFQSIMKLIHKKDYSIETAQFKIFDLIDLNEFNNKRGHVQLNDRLNRLNTTISGLKYSSVLEMELVKDDNHFLQWQDKVSANNWEGVMIRKNIGYEGKRSKYLLKVKKFHDAEYIVTKIEPTDFRYIVEGKEITEVMLGNVIIEHKGFEVGVGSGFSIDQRKEFFKHPEKILGKTITVAYFEETKNQNGGLSLRFPTVKFIWENGRNI